MNNGILLKLLNNEQLSNTQINEFVNNVVENTYVESELGALVYGFTQKKLDGVEFCDLVTAINDKSEFWNFDKPNIVCCSGTGADNQKTFNITTCSAIVAATCGVPVVKKIKYSNSKFSSESFLKCLNIPTCCTKEDAERQFLKNGICFVQAGSYNIFDRNLANIRNELKIDSVFNLSDILIHPITKPRLFLGNAYPEMTEILLEAIKALGVQRALLVNAQNPLLDEISISSETTVYELNNGEIEKYEIVPDKFGIKRADILSVRGATPDYNANLAKDIFAGKIRDSKLDIIAMNAGAIIYLSGIARNYLEGIMKAYTAIDNGLVLEKINNLQKIG